MIAAETQEIGDILQRVQTWPSRKKLALARRLLESVEVASDSHSPGKRGLSSQQVLGICKPDGPVPNDEEVQRILEDELIKKYAS